MVRAMKIFEKGDKVVCINLDSRITRKYYYEPTRDNRRVGQTGYISKECNLEYPDCWVVVPELEDLDTPYSSKMRYFHESEIMLYEEWASQQVARMLVEQEETNNTANIIERWLSHAV